MKLSRLKLAGSPIDPETELKAALVEAKRKHSDAVGVFCAHKTDREKLQASLKEILAEEIDPLAVTRVVDRRQRENATKLLIEATDAAVARADTLQQQTAGKVAQIEMRLAHAALERETEALTSAPEEIAALAAEIVGKLKALADNAEATRRFSLAACDELPPIADAEARIRQKMGQPSPAVTQTNKVWVNAAGEVVKDQIYDYDYTRWVKNPEAVRIEEREFVVHEAQPAYPLPLKRLTSEIRLVDLEGRQIWPPS